MLCKHCGKELNEGARFCARCGTPTRGGGHAVPVSKEFRFLKTWIYSSVALVILMTIFFGLIGSFNKGFGDPFIGIIILAALFGVLVTFAVKWRKKGFVFDKTSASNLSSVEAPKLRGIGGWLILVIWGLFVTLGTCLYSVYTDVQLFANGTVAFLSDPASKVYIPAYSGLMKSELIMSIILSVAAIYLIYLFFRKDNKFPNYYVLFLIAVAVYVFLDYGLLSLMTVPVEAKEVIEEEMSKQGTAIWRVFLGALIWGSYMVKSKRVKATFTN